MIIRVMLYGHLLGTAEWNAERKSSVFQYSSEIINKIEPSPIIMPTARRIFETNRDHINFHNLPYLLADSMPDDFGNRMMKEWLSQKKLSYENINPIDRLTYVGNRGMGALEFIPANHRLKDNADIAINDIYEVAKNVLEQKKKIKYTNIDQDSLTDILRIGTSVGGARAKALVALKMDKNDNIIKIKPGDILQSKDYSYWLLKIDGANKISLGESEGMGKIEYAYYLLAQSAGIEMSKSMLIEEESRCHFITKRFDRNENGEKIHMQTFGALAGIDYKIQNATSYETLFRLMKRLQLTYNQFEQQYRRMIFNVVARNHDDHVKNFSFLMNDQNEWKISPAYDICYSYSPRGNWTNSHQSSIAGKNDHFTLKDLMEFGNLFGIKKPNVIIQEVIDAVSQWPKIASELDVPKSSIKKIRANLRLQIE